MYTTVRDREMFVRECVKETVAQERAFVRERVSGLWTHVLRAKRGRERWMALSHVQRRRRKMTRCGIHLRILFTVHRVF